MTDLKDNSETEKLLWTSGWDSTYQLLNLIRKKNRQVQPIYIADETRKSLRAELLAMKNIKKAIRESYPQKSDLILPVHIVSLSDIPHNDMISSSFQRILSKNHLGIQYEWLARFCSWKNLDHVHMSIEHETVPVKLIRDFVIIANSESEKYFLMDSKFQKNDLYAIFRYFNFPLLEITKLQMKETAENEGWMPVLQHTWFCHNPLKNMKPCGFCKPCKFAVEAGFQDRIAPIRREAGKLYRRGVDVRNKIFKNLLLSPLRKIRLRTDVY